MREVLLIAPKGIEIYPVCCCGAFPDTLLIAPKGIEIHYFWFYTLDLRSLLIAPKGIEIQNVKMKEHCMYRF